MKQYNVRKQRTVKNKKQYLVEQNANKLRTETKISYKN